MKSSASDSASSSPSPPFAAAGAVAAMKSAKARELTAPASTGGSGGASEVEVEPEPAPALGRRDGGGPVGAFILSSPAKRMESWGFPVKGEGLTMLTRFGSGRTRSNGPPRSW